MLYTQFEKQTHQHHLTCWYYWSKTRKGKWILWMMVNIFYDVVTSRMELNRKYNCALSLFDPEDHKKRARIAA